MLRVGSRASALPVPEFGVIGRAVDGHALPEVAGPRSISWRAVAGLLVTLDAFAALVATMVGVLVRFHDEVGLEYRLMVVLLPPMWIAAMMAARSYDRRFLVTGTEEFRRVITGGIWLFAGVASVSFLSHTDLSRAAVGIAVPLVTVLTLLARLAARRSMHLAVRRGRSLSRMVVVGTRDEVLDLVRHMRRVRHAGVMVIGACAVGAGSDIDVPGGPVPVLGGVDDAVTAAIAAGADTVAVAGTGALGSGAMRRLSWNLEGTGIDLVVAPAITDVAGPRIVVRPFDGLPLLHVDRPTFSGMQRVVKATFDRLLAAILVVALGPLLLAVAAAVRLTSSGPALFRQERIGQDGKPFSIFKFRTMRVDAETLRMELDHLNEVDGPLFKIRRDPRLTPIGYWLRHLSLDELPQLLNVLNGTMSIVGPRPPLRSEVERYGSDAHRRLLVKPGITGLWQVSGRSNLTWEESVRLDLYYIDNWSITLDCILLWRTVFAVIAGTGAY